MSSLVTLNRSVSPPPLRRSIQAPAAAPAPAIATTSAAIEAGRERHSDPVAYFQSHLEAVSRSIEAKSKRLDLSEWKRLWHRNQNSHGRMFVVHQHDHPVAGVHYDLRLQFSKSSSISFSVPYGLPGNPNTLRPNRMAVETRVHCLWNHLVESASHATGSLLIWDTGKFEILPYTPLTKAPETDDETSDVNSENNTHSSLSDSEKLFSAFQNRHIRLRLHGTKLPKGYTIALRLPSSNNQQPRKPARKRRRKTPTTHKQTTHETSESANDDTLTPSAETKTVAADSDNDDEDESIRTNNAYPGSENTIGSVHQRLWFLTLDKLNSGFVKATSGPDKGRWVRQSREILDDGVYIGWDPFFVRGRDVETSVVTGRTAADVMEDEGVKGYVGRKMWIPILE